MLRLIDATSRLQIKLDNEENIQIAEKIKALDPNLFVAAKEFDNVNSQLGLGIKKLWNDKGIRAVSVFLKRLEYFSILGPMNSMNTHTMKHHYEFNTHTMKHHFLNM